MIPQLERLGLTVYAIDPKSIADVIHDIRAIGRITGRPATADALTRKMAAEMASVKASRAHRKPASVMVIMQASPLWVAGPKTFVDEMIRSANATNVAFDARPGFVTFSKELAISRNPDMIITATKSDVDYFLKSPEWKTTNAVKRRTCLRHQQRPPRPAHAEARARVERTG